MTTPPVPSSLDQLLIKLVDVNGTIVPVRSAINFVGPGFSVTDNPGNDSTDVAMSSVETPAAVSLASASGTVTLTPIQLAAGFLAVSGAPSGNVTLDFGTPAQGFTCTVDITGVTFGGHSVSLKANGNTWGTSLTSSGVVRVVYNGTKFYGGSLSP